MGKKKKREEEVPVIREKKRKKTFAFLDKQFDSLDLATVKRHIVILIIAALITKFVVIIATGSVFHSFIDLFDIGYYYEHALPLLQGQIPYVNYQVDYPVLVFVPITIALVPATIAQNVMVFVYTFQLLMVLCDLMSLVCIYLIALKIWNEKTALIAGLVYATAFSTAYFVLTKYDAFPTMLLMLAVLFTVYGKSMQGYIFAVIGFFAKMFPVIAVPFMILHNAKSTSIKQEIFSVVKVAVPLFVILFIPIFILHPASINTYLFATGSGVGVYVNSATYTLYTYIHEIGHLGVSSDALSLVMYAIMGIVFLLLLYLAYTEKEQNPKKLLKIVLCAIFSLVFFTKFHSPQYIVWFTPFLCLLISDDLIKIGLFYVTQIFAYIEFPLMFGNYYVNLQYVNPVGSASWYLTLIFFTLEYLALLALVFLIIRPHEGFRERIKKMVSRT
ncbi:MAG: hypothetical protein STSR0009_04340 [Methanoregula sp.]